MDNAESEEEEEDEEKCTIDWQQATVDNVVEEKRMSGDKYRWVIRMLLPHIVGKLVWRDQVESGNRKPSEVATPSDEALLLVAMDCYWSVWGAKAKHEFENKNKKYPPNMPSPLYMKTNSQKTSWTNEGVARFNEIKAQVEADRNSPVGRKFESDFQIEMATKSGNRGKKRKATSQVVQPMNDLSSEEDEPGDDDDDDSS